MAERIVTLGGSDGEEPTIGEVRESKMSMSLWWALNNRKHGKPSNTQLAKVCGVSRVTFAKYMREPHRFTDEQIRALEGAMAGVELDEPLPISDLDGVDFDAAMFARAQAEPDFLHDAFMSLGVRKRKLVLDLICELWGAEQI